MCIALKYGIWNVAEPEVSAVNTLVSGGYAPLAAMVLASRGIRETKDADKNGDEGICILRTPASCKLTNHLEMRDERICKAVCDLKSDSQKHREDEEYRHILVFEERESFQAETIGESLLLFRNRAARAAWKGKRVQEHEDAKNSGCKELIVGILKLDTCSVLHKVHEKHGTDETYCTEYSYRRIILDCIISVVLKDSECH